jgi:hypothetical protein
MLKRSSNLYLDHFVETTHDHMDGAIAVAGLRAAVNDSGLCKEIGERLNDSVLLCDVCHSQPAPCDVLNLR